MAKRIRAVVVALAVGGIVAGCGGNSFWASGEQEFPPTNASGSRQIRDARREQNGTIWNIFGGGVQAGNVQLGEERREALAGNVNRHLWQASLDTLSFMPIASTDPFTGLIATDWATAGTEGAERFKVTAHVTDVTLTPAALRVAVFREERDRRGEWITAPVSAETPRQIEDAILVRARQIRIAEEEGEG